MLPEKVLSETAEISNAKSAYRQLPPDDETTFIITGNFDRLRGDLMKRVRQIIVALVGLFYVGLFYPLCTELWHSKWLLEMHDNECEPMFITFLVSLGVFLLLAVWKPSKYRIVVAFAAFQALAHAITMLIQSVETSLHKVPRGYDDVILFGVIGVALLLCVPPKEKTNAVVDAL